MIVAAGLTPAWQQIVRLDRLELGEVNRAREVHWCGSGKVLNVGVALAHLNAPSRTVALLGGPTRDRIDAEFDELGIERRWVRSLAPTRVCTTLLDEATGQTTELVENAAAVTTEELAEFQSVFAEEAKSASIVVLTGSLPAGTPSTFYRDLLDVTPCRAVLDVRGPELIHALERRPFLIKPNREELGLTVGHPLRTDDELRAAMRNLVARGATWVVVTQGKAAVWATSADGNYRITPPLVAVVNPIGAGDCLAAGIASGLARDLPVLDALRIGIAAACENVGQLLPARINLNRVMALAEQLALEVDS